MEEAQSSTETKKKSFVTRIKDFLKLKMGKKKANEAEQSPPPLGAPDCSGERCLEITIYIDQ